MSLRVEWDTAQSGKSAARKEIMCYMKLFSDYRDCSLLLVGALSKYQCSYFLTDSCSYILAVLYSVA